jgi:hypothetical protein
MSGILLPGQENEPRSEGKIELPSGYASAQRRPAVSPDEQRSQQAGEQVAVPGEAQAADEERSGELLFPPQGARVRCPSCGAENAVPVFSIVDLGANPELRAPLLSGQINVAICQTCGAGGPLAIPLMVHDPEHEFLGVYTPLEGTGNDLQQQKVIGDLTRMLMTKIPSESRKGYLLQPRPYVDMERMLERLWEFEGVTPEMLRRQREQSSLLQRLVSLVDDDSALNMAMERSGDLIDRDFFSLLDQILVVSRSQSGNGGLDSIVTLREKLLDRTEAGHTIRQQQDRVRALLSRITEQSTRQDVLEILLNAWQEEDGRELVGTIALATGIAADYEFLMLLSQRIDAIEDADARANLEELRKHLVGLQDQIAAHRQQTRQVAMQQAQELLQEVLQENDTESALRERADEIDEAFMALLAENIRRAEESGAKAAARRLARVYEQALTILQEAMPEDMRLLNQLVTAPDDTTARQLLRENRSLVTPDLLANMSSIERQMRDSGRTEIADRIKSLRGQVALMM